MTPSPPSRKRDAHPRADRQSGYSTMDLLATLAAVAVLAVVVLPSAQSSIRTYQRNGAARELLAQVRSAQGLAVVRGGVFGLQWGADPGINYSPSEFRLARDTTGSCGFPAKGATEDGTNVVAGWSDLSDRYPGVRIASVLDANDVSLGGVMFDARGASVNTCTSGVVFPVRVTVSDASGNTRVIQIQSAGGARLL